MKPPETPSRPPSGLLELLVPMLADGNLAKFPVTGNSMTPFVRAGDVLTLAPLRREAGIEPGDLVAFVRSDHQLVVHRVLARDGIRLQTRGDGVGTDDEPISTHDVLGTVVAIERRGRPIGFGLGAERRFLARASRWGWLRPLARARRWMDRWTTRRAPDGT